MFVLCHFVLVMSLVMCYCHADLLEERVEKDLTTGEI